MAIPFLNKEKAVNYFIHFAKYQNYICWDNCSLQKVVNDALPARIWDELCFSHEDLSLFEGLKRLVLRIDNDYWKHQLEDKHKFWGTHTLSNTSTRPLREEPIKSVSTTEFLASPDRNLQDKSRPLFPAPCNDPLAPPLSGVPGPDSHLTPTKCQRQLFLGLCMHCKQTGYLARSCPCQTQHPVVNVEAYVAILDPSPAFPESPKKELAVPSFSWELTA